MAFRRKHQLIIPVCSEQIVKCKAIEKESSFYRTSDPPTRIDLCIQLIVKPLNFRLVGCLTDGPICMTGPKVEKPPTMMYKQI
jgi:hypothetical protein